MTGFALVSTTVGTAEKAQELARALVEVNLAACVQIMPVRSVYRWEGAIEAALEHLLVCKISTGAYAAVERAIRANHDYDIPEIVMVPIAAGSRAYLAWMADAVGTATET